MCNRSTAQPHASKNGVRQVHTQIAVPTGRKRPLRDPLESNAAATTETLAMQGKGGA